MHVRFIKKIELEPENKSTYCPLKGDASYFSIPDTPGMENCAWSYEESLEFSKPIKGLIAFYGDKVKIEIQGHVNGPNRRNSKALQDLSEDRAEAVFNYLTKRGIAKERMTFVGYGNTQMIHPEPKYSHESEKNRRVEVKILENSAFKENDVAEGAPPSDK